MLYSLTGAGGRWEQGEIDSLGQKGEKNNGECIAGQRTRQCKQKTEGGNMTGRGRKGGGWKEDETNTRYLLLRKWREDGRGKRERRGDRRGKRERSGGGCEVGFYTAKE